jgi:hypothetical protein
MKQRMIIDIRQDPPVLYAITDEYIKRNINKQIHNKDKIQNFLEKAGYLSIVLNDTKSIFGEERIEHMETILTDGSWVWSADINHYLINHNFELPRLFLKHIKNSNYTPTLTQKSFDNNDVSEEECNHMLNKIYFKGYLKTEAMQRQELF